MGKCHAAGRAGERGPTPRSSQIGRACACFSSINGVASMHAGRPFASAPPSRQQATRCALSLCTSRAWSRIWASTPPDSTPPSGKCHSSQAHEWDAACLAPQPLGHPAKPCAASCWCSRRRRAGLAGPASHLPPRLLCLCRQRVVAAADLDPDNASILVCGGGGVALHVTRKLKDMGSWVWMLQRTGGPAGPAGLGSQAAAASRSSPSHRALHHVQPDSTAVACGLP